MAFDFEDEFIDDGFKAGERFKIPLSDIEVAIEQVLKYQRKAPVEWPKDIESKREVVKKIIDKTAMADFHRKKGYISSDENAVIYALKIKDLFLIYDEVWNVVDVHLEKKDHVVLTVNDYTIFLAKCSIGDEIKLSLNLGAGITSMLKERPILAFEKITEVNRGIFNIKASELPNYIGALYAFRGVYGIDGHRISDYATL